MKYQWFQRIFGTNWQGGRAKRLRRRGDRYAPARRLLLEQLEARETPAAGVAPFVQQISFPDVNNQTVTPGGNFYTPTNVITKIAVTFSENVTGADVAANYSVYDTNGQPITVSGVTYDSVSFTATVSVAAPTGGTLPAGAYTVYMRGPNIKSTDDATALPLAGNGQLAAINAAANSLTLINVPGDVVVPTATTDTTTGALVQGVTAHSGLHVLPAQTNITPGGQPNVVRLRDLDNDGYPDLIIASSNGQFAGAPHGTIYIYGGRPEGGFNLRPDVSFDSGGVDPVDLGITDLNGDNLLDIMCVNFGDVNNVGGNFTVFFNSTAFDASGKAVGILYKSPQIYTAGIHPIAITQPNSVTGGLTDYSLDGFTDVVVANQGPDPVGPWTVSEFVGIPIPTRVPPFIMAFNANAINIQVGAIPDPVPNTSSLHHPTGITNYGGGVIISGTNGLLILIDDNGVLKQPTDANGNPVGLFTTGFHTSVAENGPDVVATTPSTIQVFHLGPKAVPDTILTAPAEGGLTNITVRNIDGTGLNEFLAIGATTGQVFIWHDGDPTGTPPLVVVPVGGPPPPLQPGARSLDISTAGLGPASHFWTDTNTDNTPDLVTAFPGRNIATLTKKVHQVGTGNANSPIAFQVPPQIAGGLSSPTQIINADTNTDALKDLVAVNQGSSTVSVLLAGAAGGGAPQDNYGAPTIFSTIGTDPVTGFPSGRQPISVAAGSLTGGGTLSKPDLIVASYQDSSVVVLKPSGAGYVFATTTAIAPIPVQPTKIVVGDFNGDGFLDVAVSFNGAGDPTRGVAVLLGNGDRSFQKSTIYLRGVRASNIATLDVDNDGKLDLVVTEDDAPGSVHVLHNIGGGKFEDGGAYPTNPNPQGLTIADMNNDGYPDIVTVSRSTLTTENVAVLLNNANGGFGFGTPLFTTISKGLSLNSVEATNLEHRPSDPTANPLNPYDPTAIPDNQRLAFPDLVVGTFNDPFRNDVYTLTGLGDGTFVNIFNYVTRPQEYTGTSLALPSSDPLVKLATFYTGGKSVRPNLISNGDFQRRDLEVQNNSVSGWTTFSQDNSKGIIGGQLGQRSQESLTNILRSENTQASLDETTPFPVDFSGVDPATGAFNTLAAGFAHDFNLTQPYAAAYAGTQALYQDVTVPANAATIQLKFRFYYKSQSSLTDPFSQDPNHALDYSNQAIANQSFRVDLVDPLVDTATDPISGLTDSNGPLRTNPDSPQNPGVIINLVQSRATTDRNGVTIGNGGVLLTTYGGTVPLTVISKPQPNVEVLEQEVDYSSSLPASVYAGKKVRVRFAAAHNQGQLQFTVDNVSLAATYTDTTVPVLTNIHLRNPGVVNGPLNALYNHTSDPTIDGRVTDNGGVNNVQFLQFDYVGQGTNSGAFYRFRANYFDALGNFTMTPSQSLQAGPYLVNVTAFDNANNLSITQTIPFVSAGPSLTVWKANGPGPIDASAFFDPPNPAVSTISTTSASVTGVDFQNIAGRVNAVVVDPSDPTGATMYVGAQEGGVWKTSNGGRSWSPTTDFLQDGTTGQPYLDANGNVGTQSIGGLAISLSNPKVLYAGTGVGDTDPTSRVGFGILKTTNGGASWLLLPSSKTQLLNARVSRMAVDGNDQNRAYAAVAAGGAQGPGVYRTEDGGSSLTGNWVNVFRSTGSNLFLEDGTNVPADDALPSVTDLVIDPRENNVITIGAGNVGLIDTSPAAGLPNNPYLFSGIWQSSDFGNTWHRIVGGNNQQIPNNFLPSGPVVGRVTITQDHRIGALATFYILVGEAPPNPVTATDTGKPVAPGGGFNNGTTITDANGTTDRLRLNTGGSGLYKSKDGLLNFTKVTLRENRINVPSSEHQNINLVGTQAGAVGALAIDPNDDNVVYVGGSAQYTTPTNSPLTNPNRVALREHSLIRVDTGNMQDTTYIGPAPIGLANDGDDITKAIYGIIVDGNVPYTNVPVLPYGNTGSGGAPAPGGEGVNWFDLYSDSTNNSLGTGSLGITANLPYGTHFLTFDPRGRLLVGNNGGVYRVVQRGYGYDFTTGHTGVIGVYTGPLDLPPQFTSLNGNLQISDVNAVAIDPLKPTRIYTAQAYGGTAVSVNGSLQFKTTGLISPILSAPAFPNQTGSMENTDGVAIRAASPGPGGQADSVYRVFANLTGIDGRLVKVPEFSINSGGELVNRPIDNALINTFTPAANGININDQAPIYPVLVLNPNKVIQNGIQQDQLLFGTTRLYLTNANSNLWTDLAGRRLAINAGEVITAAAFGPQQAAGSPSNPIYTSSYYVGTNQGEVFVELNSQGTGAASQSDGFPLRNAGLPALPVQAIAVNPNDKRQAYVSFGGTATGTGRVFFTSTGGQTWIDVTGDPTLARIDSPQFYTAAYRQLHGVAGRLPDVAINSLVLDPRPYPASPSIPTQYSNPAAGRLYAGTDAGVFISYNGGAAWFRLGVGLPNDPVVDMQFLPQFELLAVAVRGRGVFTISTDVFGPQVVSISPASPVNPGISQVTVTFNEQIRANTFTPADVKITGPVGQLAATSVTAVDPTDPKQFVITFATQTYDGVYNVQVGPNIEDVVDISNSGLVPGIPAFSGNLMNQNGNSFNGEQPTGTNPGDAFVQPFDINSTDSGRFVSGLYNDVLGRPSETNGFIAWLASVDAARSPQQTAEVTSLLNSLEFRQKLVAAAFQKFLGRAPVTTETNFYTAQLSVGLPQEQVFALLVGGPEYFANPAKGNNNNTAWLTAAWKDLLGRVPITQEVTFYVPLLNSGALTRQGLASGLVKVAEFQYREVRAFYSNDPTWLNGFETNFLGRAAVAAELASWSQAMQNGATTNQVIAGILGSNEFYLDQPSPKGANLSTAKTFVTALYQKLLQRAGTANEITAASNAVVGGYSPTRYAVAAAFTSSPEYLGNQITNIFKHYLRRAPVASELSAWLQSISAGTTLEQVAARIIGSDEYFNQVGLGSNLTFVQMVYQDVLNRPASLAEQGAALNYLNQPGIPPSSLRFDVALTLLTSGEYRGNLIQSTFLTILRRNAAPAEVAAWQSALAQGVRDEQFSTSLLSSTEYELIRPTINPAFP